MDLTARAMAASAAGRIVSDNTYSAEWISGMPSANADTDMIMLPSGHGLANGDCVEVTGGSGALPTPFFEYNCNDMGGYYANVINLSANTCQLSNTVGGTTPIDITSVGTVGWKIRKAGIPSFSVAVDPQDKNCDILIKNFGYAKLTASYTSMIILANQMDINSRFVSYLGGFTLNYLDISFGQTAKYSVIPTLLSVRFLSEREALIFVSAAGTSSDSGSSPYTQVFPVTKTAWLKTPSKITSLQVSLGQRTTALIRNGVQTVITRL